MPRSSLGWAWSQRVAAHAALAPTRSACKSDVEMIEVSFPLHSTSCQSTRIHTFLPTPSCSFALAASPHECSCLPTRPPVLLPGHSPVRSPACPTVRLYSHSVARPSTGPTVLPFGHPPVRPPGHPTVLSPVHPPDRSSDRPVALLPGRPPVLPPGRCPFRLADCAPVRLRYAQVCLVLQPLKLINSRSTCLPGCLGGEVGALDRMPARPPAQQVLRLRADQMAVTV